MSEMPQKRELLYEGKAKKVYATDDPELLIVSYKDDATAFNGLKKGTIVGKGVINNRMSDLLMARLEREGIPTHLVRELNDRDTLVKRVAIVPWRSSCATLPPAPFPSGTGWPKERSFTGRPWSFPIRMMSWGTLCSTTTMCSPWGWLPRRR